MDLLPTIEDDEEVQILDESETEETEQDNKKQEKKYIKRKKNDGKGESGLFSKSFQFNMDGGDVFEWQMDEAIAMATAREEFADQMNSVDAKIHRAREMRKLKKERLKAEGGEGEKGDGEENGEESQEGKEEGEDTDSDSSEGEGEGEEDQFDDVSQKEEKKKLFFSKSPLPSSANIAFTDMNLSRPLLKAVTALGFATPTSVQARTIPLALMGKDICACAATGTGKTAAFMLPVLERLLYRPTRLRSTRVLILLPTRELAIQVHSVGKALAQNTKIEFCLAAGGLDSRRQEASLRKNPDIIIATPGRLVDHLHNTPSFSLQDIEILILDEADRMLDEHFLDQMNEIIRLCPVSRQTLLFSATMTDEVEELVRLSLQEPVRVFIDSNTDTADNLYQEFIRVRSSKEDEREPIVTALCLRTFKDHCLIFVPTKKQAHRLRLILGLLGLKSSELHGSLNQLQRLEALRDFKNGQVDVLVATDLAARGLDIENVRTVVNFSMPPTLKQYIHRVGRTARAGKSGKSVTLVGEKGRKVLKEVVKKAKCSPKSRVIPHEVIEKYKQKIVNLENEIREIIKQEEEEKQVQVTQMEVTKAKNLIVHHDEIHSRPPRVWFQDNKGGKRKATGDGNSRSGKRVKKEESEEEKAARREIDFAKRETKRSQSRRGKVMSLPSLKKKGRKDPKPVISSNAYGSNKKNGQRGRGGAKNKQTVVVKSKGNKFKSKGRYKRK